MENKNHAKVTPNRINTYHDINELTSVHTGGSTSVSSAYMSLNSLVVDRPPITNIVPSTATALCSDRRPGPRPLGDTWYDQYHFF